VVDDLAAVVAPPYDVIGPEAHRRLLGRDPPRALIPSRRALPLRASAHARSSALAFRARTAFA